jgi:hypothetical protein
VIVKTIGISPKVLIPVLAQAAALLVNWIATGAFDRVEVAQVVGLGLTAVLGAWAGPGEVAVEIGPASDSLLPKNPEP